MTMWWLSRRNQSVGDALNRMPWWLLAIIVLLCGVAIENERERVSAYWFALVCVAFVFGGHVILKRLGGVLRMLAGARSWRASKSRKARGEPQPCNGNWT